MLLGLLEIRCGDSTKETWGGYYTGSGALSACVIATTDLRRQGDVHIVLVW